MPSIRTILTFAVFIVFFHPLHARLVWTADFGSYDASAGPVEPVIDASGRPDTFSSKGNSGSANISFSTQVAPSTLNGNALKLSFSNTAASGVSGIYLLIYQSNLSALNGSGIFSNAMVLSYDVVRTSSAGGNSRSYAATPAGSSGNNNTTTAALSGVVLRYTFVTNQTGLPISLPGSLGTLANNSSASYYFDGSVYSGLAVVSGISSTDIAGFGTGVFRSNSLSAGTTVTVWCDNMGLWNVLSDAVNGVSVLSLPPGTIIPAPPSATPAGLIWAADFESYDTSAGAVDVTISPSGEFDTLSSKTSSGGSGVAFSAQVAPSVLSGNALKLSLTNATGAGISATYMLVGQNRQPTLNGNGVYVLTCDAVRTGGNGISGSRSYAATPAGNTGGHNTSSTGFAGTPLRYTFVINQTGAAISLPASLGSLANNRAAGYYFDGATYSGLTAATTVSGSSVSGFSTGVYRSNSLASGSTVSVWLDNMSLWNSLTAVVNGSNVLSLPPGTVVMSGPSVWHVDANTGNDAHAGLTAQAALATIQRAVDLAQPGDTVLVHPGIYYEHVLVRHGGTATKPIRILADQVAENRVILTGAVRAIREKTATWQLVDSALGLYRIPLGYRPTRVLADRADLLPYPNLNDLNAFRYLEDNYPGHRHGFAWDPAGNSLYVRLRADGTYGATNPNSAVLAVSPPTGSGSLGQTPTRPGDFLFKLQMTGPAHVVIDGFTFETPGIAAVYTAGSDVVVRNCWFYGCRSGVSAGGTVHRVTVEQCYYTQYPAYSDILDTIHDEAAAQLAKPEDWQRLMHWQRKGGNLPVSGGVGVAYSYESGFTRGMGQGWIVRNNHLYEIFEGFSAGCTSNSQGAQIYGNRFERICDNAVETESHAQDLHIRGNLIIDTFEPFSWQPQEGIVLPGRIYISDNTITQTPETSAAWETARFDPGLFKIGIATDDMWNAGKMGSLPRNVAEAPGGFWAAHNTLLVARGRMLTALNPTSRSYKGFAFLNNIAGTRLTTSRAQTGIVFEHNFLATYNTQPTPQELTTYGAMAGPHGEYFFNPQLLNLVSLANGGLVPGSNCPANGHGLTSSALSLPDGNILNIPAEVPLRSNPGAEAFQSIVGPRPR